MANIDDHIVKAEELRKEGETKLRETRQYSSKFTDGYYVAICNYLQALYHQNQAIIELLKRGKDQ